MNIARLFGTIDISCISDVPIIFLKTLILFGTVFVKNHRMGINLPRKSIQPVKLMFTFAWRNIAETMSKT